MSGCDEIRELLWPLDRPREHVEGEEEARAHLAVCEECREFFRRDALLTSAIRSSGVEVPAPPEVRERVFDALARERALSGGRPKHRRLRIGPGTAAPWLVAAAAILIGLVAGLAWSGSSGEGSGVYAQDFLSRAVEEDALETGDVRALTAFFRREMGVPVEPVQLASTPPSRAMICLIDGRRAAMVEYEIEGYTLAHYQIPLEGRRPRASAGLRMSEENGVCVYRWSDGRFEHALVSDMPAARLRQIAETGFLSSGGTSP